MSDGPQGEQGETGEVGETGARGPVGPRGRDGSLPEDFMGRFDAAVASVDRLYEEIARENAIRNTENAKRDQRIKTNRRWNRGVMVLALIGILVGVRGVRLQHEANASTKAARIGSCLQYNRQQADQTQAEISQSHDLIATLAKGAPKGPATDAAVARYNRSHDALIRGEHKARDCSPAGIKKYLSTPTKETP